MRYQQMKNMLAALEALRVASSSTARSPNSPTRSGGWAHSIREGGLHVDMADGVSVPLESGWPGGHVVTVRAGMGHAYYFAMPCQALPFAIELAVEMDRRIRQARQGSDV